MWVIIGARDCVLIEYSIAAIHYFDILSASTYFGFCDALFIHIQIVFITNLETSIAKEKLLFQFH